MKPKNVKSLQAQSRNLQVGRVDHNTLVVSSITNEAANHIVTVNFDKNGKVIHARCTCEWAKYHGVGCTHVMAALEHLASLKDRKLSFWGSKEDALRQKQRIFLLGTDENSGLWITSRSG